VHGSGVTARLDGLDTDQLKQLIDTAEQRIAQATILDGAEAAAPRCARLSRRLPGPPRKCQVH
jgi:hypothetical protein